MSNNSSTSLTKNSYSQALFELASEKNSINDIEVQVSAILGLIDKSKDFKDLIKDPTNKIEDQLIIMNKISSNNKVAMSPYKL